MNKTVLKVFKCLFVDLLFFHKGSMEDKTILKVIQANEIFILSSAIWLFHGQILI